MTKRRKTSNSLSQETPTAMETVCPPSVSSPNAASVIRTRSQLKKPSEAADSSNEHTVQPARSNKAAKSAGSNQATDSHTQTRTRSNALIVSADKPNESARPQSEEHHSTPITNGLPVPEERSLTASQPDTSTEEPYSAIDSPEPPVSPESIEEFNSNRRQAIRANNKKVYANVARDLSKYNELIDEHLGRFETRMKRLVQVSLVNEKIVKNSHVAKILERKESLQKAKTYLSEHIQLFKDASLNLDDDVIECPPLPEHGSDAADCNELTKLVFEKQVIKKKIFEIQAGLLALREVYQADSINEKNLIDFNFKKHETELTVVQDKLHGLLKAMCKVSVEERI